MRSLGRINKQEPLQIASQSLLLVVLSIISAINRDCYQCYLSEKRLLAGLSGILSDSRLFLQ